MNSRVFWKYYFNLNFYNFLFSLVCGSIFTFVWGILVFFSLGIIVGAIGFRYFQNNQYYMYHNLGFSKMRLIKNVLAINAIIVALVMLILYLIK